MNSEIRLFVDTALAIAERTDPHPHDRTLRLKYACQMPERPFADALLEMRCKGCLIGISASIRIGLNRSPLTVPVDGRQLAVYGDDRLAILDELTRIAANATPLPRIVEEVVPA